MVRFSNLSTDVLISGTYVNSLFVMQKDKLEREILGWPQHCTRTKGKGEDWKWYLYVYGTPPHTTSNMLLCGFTWDSFDRDMVLYQPGSHFCLMCLFLFSRVEWPGLPPDLASVMTVVYHVLSAAVPHSQSHPVFGLSSIHFHLTCRVLDRSPRCGN